MPLATFDVKPAERGIASSSGSPAMTGRATSSFTREDVIRRLQAIRGDVTIEAAEERRFLRGVLAQKFPEK